MALLGLDFQVLEDSLKLRFQRQGQAAVDENVSVARAGYDYAMDNFQAFPGAVPTGPKPLAVWAGNEAIAMGGAAAGSEILRRLPHEPVHGSPPLDGGQRQEPGHHGAPG